MKSCLKFHLYYFQVSKVVRVSTMLALGKYFSILWVRATNKARLTEKVTFHLFSGFWLWSSVVFVINLISDMSSLRGHYIKWTFGAGRWNRSLLCPLHASTRCCSTSGNSAPPGGRGKEKCPFSVNNISYCTWCSKWTVLVMEPYLFKNCT